MLWHSSLVVIEGLSQLNRPQEEAHPCDFGLALFDFKHVGFPSAPNCLPLSVHPGVEDAMVYKGLKTIADEA